MIRLLRLSCDPSLFELLQFWYCTGIRVCTLKRTIRSTKDGNLTGCPYVLRIEKAHLPIENTKNTIGEHASKKCKSESSQNPGSIFIRQTLPASGFSLAAPAISKLKCVSENFSGNIPLVKCEVRAYAWYRYTWRV